MNPDIPVDPSAAMTKLGEAMTSLQEMFRAAVEAGFTEAQAMQIVLETIRTMTPRP